MNEIQRNPKRVRKKEQRRAKIEEQIRLHNARRRRIMGINLALLMAVFGGVGFMIFKSNKDAGAVACGGSTAPAAIAPTDLPAPASEIDKAKTYVAVMTTSCGTIEITLDDEISPNTVNSFVSLARKGFYNGLIFHRLVAGFALQGGDPLGTGSGGPGYKVVDAPPEGFKYVKGVVAMAKAESEPPGTSGSQFFIVPGDGASSLPAEYAVLGRVTKGEKAVAKIAGVPTEAAGGGQGEKSNPLQTVYILKITIRES